MAKPTDGVQTMQMTTASDVVLALEACPGRLDKEALLARAWQLGIVEFFKGARMAYDALATFGVKKVPLIEDEDDPSFSPSMTWDRFAVIAARLESRELTGNMARDTLRAAADASSVRDWNGFYRRVLLKDLKCGVTESTINKVLERIGKKDASALGHVIPVFSCQLAKPAEDNPRHMRGQKLLDAKLDGVRILAFLDRDRNEVILRTREGRIKENFPHVETMLKNIIPHLKESMVLDGEMVSRSFQTLMTQLNRSEDVDTSDAKFALFDCLPVNDFMTGECGLTQIQRHEALVLFEPLLASASNGSIYVVPKLLVDLDTEEGMANFREFNREAVDAGYEGIMIKDPNATYVTKRSVNWLKIKPKITVDLEVVGFENGNSDGKFSETLGGMICEGEDNGRKIRVTVGGGYSEELRTWIWDNRDRVLGCIVEIESDAITKPQDGEHHGLRFPQFHRFRGRSPGEKL